MRKLYGFLWVQEFSVPYKWTVRLVVSGMPITLRRSLKANFQANARKLPAPCMGKPTTVPDEDRVASRDLWPHPDGEPFLPAHRLSPSWKVANKTE